MCGVAWSSAMLRFFFNPGAKTASHAFSSPFRFAPRLCLGFLVAAAVTLTSFAVTPASAQGMDRRGPRMADASRPHVYLMRGLMNIFSLGMDQLEVEIQRYGIAASVYNHAMADEV